MKKLLLMAIVAPMCLIACDETWDTSDIQPLSSRAMKLQKLSHSTHKHRLDFEPFWRNIERGNIVMCDDKLSRMEAETFNDHMYIDMCYLYMACLNKDKDAIRGAMWDIQYDLMMFTNQD